MKGEVLQLNKQWLVHDRIGGGGFGQVYEVTAADGSGRAAAKFVPEAPQSERELLFVDLPGVPNVVPVVDRGQHDHHHVLVMPLADRSLRDLLDDEPVPSLDMTLGILIDVAEALAGLDGKVVHRDLKPENVLYVSGRWCIADFGISRYADATTATNTSKFSLSMPYAGPERWRLEHADPSTDVYSLGVLAFEMLMGHWPFPGPQEADFRDQHLHKDAPKVTAGSVPLQSLVTECLYKSTGARPTAANVLARLKGMKAAPVTGALAALQNANQAQVSVQAEQARQTSAAKTRSERRAVMFKDASAALDLISQQFGATIQENAPAAQVNSLSGLTLALGDGRLQIKTPEQVQPGALSERGSPIDLIASSSIAVGRPADSRGYRGRSHSLWFCDAIIEGEFAWYETAFMDVNLGRSSYPSDDSITPYSLAPGEQAARALWAGMDVVQVAWPFTPVRPGAMDDFLERWVACSRRLPLATFSDRCNCPSAAPVLGVANPPWAHCSTRSLHPSPPVPQATVGYATVQCLAPLPTHSAVASSVNARSSAMCARVPLGVRPPVQLRHTGCMRSDASTAAIRQWAREQGIAVGDRGRLAPAVLAAYQSAASATASKRQGAGLAGARPTILTNGYRIATSPVSGATGTGRRVRARVS